MIVAWSRMLPDKPGFVSRHCFAVIPKSATFSSNSIEIQAANLKAMSLYAKVPPYLPDLHIMPTAFVAPIHFWGDNVNAFRPACFLNSSNSRGLKFGLYNVSHRPKYSMVFRFLIQFPITALGSSVQTQIDLSHYAAGVYFVKAVADGNVVAVRKMVKR